MQMVWFATEDKKKDLGVGKQLEESFGGFDPLMQFDLREVLLALWLICSWITQKEIFVHAVLNDIWLLAYHGSSQGVKTVEESLFSGGTIKVYSWIYCSVQPKYFNGH